MSAQERQTQFEQIDVLLRQLFDLDVRLPAQIKDRWDEFLAQQKRVETQRQANEPAGLVRLVRALRTSSIGFATTVRTEFTSLSVRCDVTRSTFKIRNGACSSVFQRLPMQQKQTLLNWLRLSGPCWIG
jgi:hypothetical protein